MSHEAETIREIILFDGDEAGAMCMCKVLWLYTMRWLTDLCSTQIIPSPAYTTATSIVDDNVELGPPDSVTAKGSLDPANPWLDGNDLRHLFLSQVVRALCSNCTGRCQKANLRWRSHSRFSLRLQIIDQDGQVIEIHWEAILPAAGYLPPAKPAVLLSLSRCTGAGPGRIEYMTV